MRNRKIKGEKKEITQISLLDGSYSNCLSRICHVAICVRWHTPLARRTSPAEGARVHCMDEAAKAKHFSP